MRVSDLAVAAMALQAGHSLVVVREGALLTYRQGRGIKPLLALLEEGIVLEGTCLGDKVMGRAAALLAVYAGVKAVYTPIISRPALEVLHQHGVRVAYRCQVERILNRRGTSTCPMEELAIQIEDPADAPARIRGRLRELQQAAANKGRGQQ